MSELSLEGRVKLVMDVQTFESGFTKREFVVTTNEQYPQDVKFELLKDKTSLINGYKVGDSVKVHLNIRGNEYNGRYFVNLQAWKLEGGQSGEASAPAPKAPPTITNDDDDSELPF